MAPSRSDRTQQPRGAFRLFLAFVFILILTFAILQALGIVFSVSGRSSVLHRMSGGMDDKMMQELEDLRGWFKDNAAKVSAFNAGTLNVSDVGSSDIHLFLDQKEKELTVLKSELRLAETKAATELGTRRELQSQFDEKRAEVKAVKTKLRKSQSSFMEEAARGRALKVQLESMKEELAAMALRLRETEVSSANSTVCSKAQSDQTEETKKELERLRARLRESEQNLLDATNSARDAKQATEESKEEISALKAQLREALSQEPKGAACGAELKAQTQLADDLKEELAAVKIRLKEVETSPVGGSTDAECAKTLKVQALLAEELKDELASVRIQLKEAEAAVSPKGADCSKDLKMKGLEMEELQGEFIAIKLRWDRAEEALKNATQEGVKCAQEVEDVKMRLGELQAPTQNDTACVKELKKMQAGRDKWQAKADARLAESRDAYVKLLRLKRHMMEMLSDKNAVLPTMTKQQTMELLKQCDRVAGKTIASEVDVWKGYACNATDAEMAQYLDYEPHQLCPDDWNFVQTLIYEKDCYALPKRRCKNRTPAQVVEPLPYPRSLFDQAALSNDAVRWNDHLCKSFECLNARVVGDCRDCFNLTREARRWKHNYQGSLTIREVLDMFNGSLRIGLDAGGGTGSFAAHMAYLGNVTIMTTAFNRETIGHLRKGIPYMETIAQRGLIPLHMPHKARLPFYDNTLDIIHCVNSVKYLPMLEFEELMYDWNRVLRPGGVIWFEMFYAPVEEMAVYVGVLDALGYKKLYWKIIPKSTFSEVKGPHAYLNCLIVKPAAQDPVPAGAAAALSVKTVGGKPSDEDENIQRLIKKAADMLARKEAEDEALAAALASSDKASASGLKLREREGENEGAMETEGAMESIPEERPRENVVATEEKSSLAVKEIEREKKGASEGESDGSSKAKGGKLQEEVDAAEKPSKGGKKESEGENVSALEGRSEVASESMGEAHGKKARSLADVEEASHDRSERTEKSVATEREAGEEGEGTHGETEEKATDGDLGEKEKGGGTISEKEKLSEKEWAKMTGSATEEDGIAGHEVTKAVATDESGAVKDTKLEDTVLPS
eukprot:TRINITY_DN1266_c0_g2_i1.p1 TRINITY_DN1266_c0_g2~~TRINITY_DN1266_c0_g2_i1.p1  ORF type:complete len:1074 (-),score=238.24 TRINITY_DN1266_c0_g2_i1:1596-4817(-)